MPPFTPAERVALPAWLRIELEEYVALHERVDNTPCQWLDTVAGGCRHYNYRPGLCRRFTIGGGECLAFRRGII